MNLTNKHLIYLGLVALAATVMGWFYNQSYPSPVVEETQQIETAQTIAADYVFTASQSGATALELTQAEAEIMTKDFGDAGQFVTSINGLAADNQHYWAFYLNDEYAQQGVSQTILESGDTIKFTYEEIDSSQL